MEAPAVASGQRNRADSRPRRRLNGVVWPRLRPAAPALCGAFLVLGLVFHSEIEAAVHVWNSSTAYGHCWLILPIALFLAWERAGPAAAAAMAPRPALALLAAPLVLVWLAAYLLGIMEARQLAVFGFAEILLLAVFGRGLWRALSAPFLYLVFLVPFGAFLTPSLQGFTSAFIEHGLNLFGIANRVTGNTIEIPEGVFYVAEACAGLRFLIASIAFGALYALTMFTSPWRRVGFIATACLVPVIANGLRALGIVLLGHFIGSAQAAAADHLLYGWIFFSMVIAALAVLGMPFRQSPPPPPPPGPIPAPGTAWRAVYAAWPVLLLAAAGPSLAMLLGSGAEPQLGETSVWLAPAGCTSSAALRSQGVATQDFTCGKTRIATRLSLLPRHANPSRVVVLAQSQAEFLLTGADFEPATISLDRATPSVWQSQRDQRTGLAAATVLLLHGAPASGGLRDRIRLAEDLFGSDAPAPVVLAAAVIRSDGDAMTRLRDFLAAQGDLVGRLRQDIPAW